MASDSTLRSVLPGLMRQACREAPGMHFTVQPGDPRRIAEYLREGDFDLIISFVPNPSSDLHQTVLYPQRLMCIARDRHPAPAAGLTLETLSPSRTPGGASPPRYRRHSRNWSTTCCASSARPARRACRLPT